MKGKISCISLLFCLVVPTTATFIFLHYQKKLIRKEVKRQIIKGIDKRELVFLKFSKKESQTKLRWEHEKEFEYKGQMYDIVVKEIREDTVLYWCWWDNEETELNRQLDALVANVLGTNPVKKENQQRLIDFYKNLFCKQYATIEIYISETGQIIWPYKISWQSISYPPPVPPPRFS